MFCGRCHDPALIAEGTLARTDPLQPETFATPAAQAGVVCLTCHSVHTPPALTGNGTLQVELSPVPVKGPEHNARVASSALRTENLCASCHRVALTPDITGDRWLKGQDEYGDWLASPSGRGAPDVVWPLPERSCADCHMPKVPASTREKGARAGRVADHRFLGANGALPHLRGDVAMAQATGEALRGAAVVSIQPGGLSSDGLQQVDVVMINLKAGHRLPGGTQDSNQVWLEVTAFGERGRILWQSGGLDDEGRLDPAAHRVRSQPVDEAGDPLRHRDAHRMRGVVFDTTLPQGKPRLARYALPHGTNAVSARLMYRKFDREYLELACGALPASTKARCLTPPIYEIARGEARLTSSGLSDQVQRPADTRPSWAGLVDHGLALAEGFPDDAKRALDPLRKAQELTTSPIPDAAMAQALGRLGRTDDVAALEVSGDTPPALHWFKAVALARAYRTAPALYHAEQALAAYPASPQALALVARLKGVLGQPEGALAAADAILARDPLSEAGWFQRMMALRDLMDAWPGGEGLQSEALDTWDTIRRTDERDLALRRAFRARWPQQAPMTHPIPTYFPGP